MLIISPYDKVAQDVGHVSQERFDPGSIVKFIEQVFNLPTLESLPCNGDYYYYYGCGLGYTDYQTTAGYTNSIGDVLNMTVAPRRYGTPIPTKYGPGKFKKGGSGSGYYYSGTAPDDE